MHAGTGAELINISIQGRKQDVETIRLTAAAGEREKKNCVTTQEIQQLSVTNPVVMFVSVCRFASNCLLDDDLLDL